MMSTRTSGGQPGASPNETRPPAGLDPRFTASDGRRVWELESNLFLIQRDTGPAADDRCIAVVFDPHGIAPRLWVPSPETPGRSNVAVIRPGVDRAALTGVVWGLGMSVPLWGLIYWAIRSVLTG